MRFVIVALFSVIFVAAHADDSTVVTFILEENGFPEFHQYEFSSAPDGSKVNFKSADGKQGSVTHLSGEKITVKEVIENFIIQEVLPSLSKDDSISILVEGPDTRLISITMNADNFSPTFVDELALMSLFLDNQETAIITNFYNIETDLIEKHEKEKLLKIKAEFDDFRMLLELVKRLKSRQSIRRDIQPESAFVIALSSRQLAGLVHLFIGELTGDLGKKVVGLFLLLK